MQISEPGKYVWNDRARGIREVGEYLTAVKQGFVIDTARIILGGFSKGGGLAIWLTLHQLIAARGFVVLGPFLSEDELEELSSLLATQKPAGIRGYIIAGEEDVRCLEIARRVVDMMQAHDLPCELEIRAGLNHEYPSDFSESVDRGLAFIEQA